MLAAVDLLLNINLLKKNLSFKNSGNTIVIVLELNKHSKALKSSLKSILS